MPKITPLTPHNKKSRPERSDFFLKSDVVFHSEHDGDFKKGLRVLEIALYFGEIEPPM